MSETTAPKTLKEWRVEHFSETQAEFAEHLGVHPGTVAAWEQGARAPSLRTRRMIAEKLGISVRDIQWEAKESAAARNSTAAPNPSRAGSSSSVGHSYCTRKHSALIR